MKIKYAVVDENNNILQTSENTEELKKFGESLKNRRNGKTTRALFLALSSEKPVLFVSTTKVMSRCKYNHLYDLLKKLGFDFDENSALMEIKPRFSGKIIFIQEDFTKSKSFNKFYKDHCVVYDLEKE